MRLVQLAGYDGAYPGSSIPMILAALTEARQRGWQAEAVFAESARGRTWLDAFAAAGIPVRIVERAGRRDMARAVTALLDERPGEPTILHTHFTSYDVPAVMAARGRSEVAVVWHFHTPPEQRLAIRARIRVKLRRYGPRTAAILCVAPHMAETIEALAPAGRTRYFPNGIDTARFEPASDAHRAAARAAFGVPADATVLAHLSWDWDVKGGDRLLDAVVALRADGLRVHAVTRPGDPARARAEVAQRGVEDAVTVVERLDRIQELYEAADVFVSCSRKEGMPFAVLEALLSGVPVVASDILGHHLIADRYPGCRIVAGDGASVAVGVEELLASDPVALAADTTAARAAIVAEMGLEGWTDRLFDLYAEVGPTAAEAA